MGAPVRRSGGWLPVGRLAAGRNPDADGEPLPAGMEVLRTWIGTLNPDRAVRIQHAYPLAFFDLHLRHQRQRLLEGPCPAFPEVRYLP